MISKGHLDNTHQRSVNLNLYLVILIEITKRQSINPIVILPTSLSLTFSPTLVIRLKPEGLKFLRSVIIRPGPLPFTSVFTGQKSTIRKGLHTKVI